MNKEINVFSKVKCNGYLKKKKFKWVHCNEEDETIEKENEILLGYGASCIQDKYEIKEKEFIGIIVGFKDVYTKEEFAENYNHEEDISNIIVYGVEKKRVAKVYYTNNRSRLVPISNIQEVVE